MDARRDTNNTPPVCCCEVIECPKPRIARAPELVSFIQEQLLRRFYITMPRHNRKHIGMRRKQSSNPATRAPRQIAVQEVVETAASSTEEPCDDGSDDNKRKVERDDGFGEVLNEEHRRAAIAVAFVDVFDAPPEGEWGGIDGTISSIMRHLNINRNSRGVVCRVLDDIMKCYKDRVQYDPSRKPGTGGGHSKLIIQGSTEEKMVIDHFQGGIGLDTSVTLVNEYREQCGLAVVGRSAVYTARQRLGLKGFPPNRKVNRSGKRAKKAPAQEEGKLVDILKMDETGLGLDGTTLEIPQFDEVRV